MHMRTGDRRNSKNYRGVSFYEEALAALTARGLKIQCALFAEELNESESDELSKASANLLTDLGAYK